MCAPHTIVARDFAALTGGRDIREPFNPDAGPYAEARKKAEAEATAKDQKQMRALAPPDITDERLRAARSNQILQLLKGRGRKSTFLSGPLGPPELGQVKLGGG